MEHKKISEYDKSRRKTGEKKMQKKEWKKNEQEALSEPKSLSGQSLVAHEEYLLITFNKKYDNCLQMKRFSSQNAKKNKCK